MSEPKPAVIYTAHGFHFYSGGKLLSNFMWRSAEQLAANWTDYLVVINQEDEAFSKANGILAPERIVRMPGIGVDTSDLRRERVPDDQVNQVRAELGLTPEDKLFLMVGEFTPG